MRREDLPVLHPPATRLSARFDLRPHHSSLKELARHSYPVADHWLFEPNVSSAKALSIIVMINNCEKANVFFVHGSAMVLTPPWQRVINGLLHLSLQFLRVWHPKRTGSFPSKCRREVAPHSPTSHHLADCGSHGREGFEEASTAASSCFFSSFCLFLGFFYVLLLNSVRLLAFAIYAPSDNTTHPWLFSEVIFLLHLYLLLHTFQPHECFSSWLLQ